MRYPIKLALAVVMAGAVTALPSWSQGQQKKQTEDEGVREAIRFERMKQAAADRQARIEARRGSADRAAGSQTQSAAKRSAKTRKHNTGSASRQKQQ